MKNNIHVTEKSLYLDKIPMTTSVTLFYIIYFFYLIISFQCEKILFSDSSFKTITTFQNSGKRSKNKTTISSKKSSNVKSLKEQKINKKDFNNNIIKNCQTKYNSFLKTHKDVTMSGTKRYENKSGGYYLQNSVKFLRNNKNPLNQKAFTKPNLNNNKNNKNLIRVNRKLLFDELVPLPKMKQKNKLKCDYEQKNLNNAVNNAKYIRRYQYSKNLEKKQILKNKENKKNEKLFLSKIKYIQIWWKTIFQIIKIQKFIRGALYRIKLVKIIQNQKRYFGKILNFVNKIKKICWKNFLINQRPYIKYYFKKWKEKISKKIIIEELRKYLIKKEFKETKYNSDKNNKNSRSNNDLNKEVNKINLKKKDININNSLFDLYNVSFFNRNSSQPFLTIKNKNENNKRNIISLGLEGSFSSKFIQKIIKIKN